MRIIFAALCLSLSVATSAQDTAASPTPLLKSDITGIENHEVLMTHVAIPANTSLPMHYHPTEEFLYVIKGETVLRIKGKGDTVIKAGTSGKIPAGEIHTAITHGTAAEVIVFRVHPKGKPVRIVPKTQE